MTVQTKKIEFDNETIKNSITFAEMMDMFSEEIEDYTKLKLQEELSKQKVVVSLYDVNGGIVAGNITDVIGWLEVDNVLLIGEVTDVYWTKEDNEKSELTTK